MSSILLKSLYPQYEVIVGYDASRSCFFGEVYDITREDYDVDKGLIFSKYVPTFYDLITLIELYAEIPVYVKNKLEENQEDGKLFANRSDKILKSFVCII